MVSLCMLKETTGFIDFVQASFRSIVSDMSKRVKVPIDTPAEACP